MDWQLRYESALPPLPEGIKVNHPRSALELLPQGGWLVRLTPKLADQPPLPVYYEGTWRIQWEMPDEWDDSPVLDDIVDPGPVPCLFGSGDLYRRQVEVTPGKKETYELPDFSPRREIPTFPRASYRYYFLLESAQFFAAKEAVQLGFRSFKLTQSSPTWAGTGRVEALLKRQEVEYGWSNSTHYFEGFLRNEGGTPIAKVELGRIGKYFRRAWLRIDKARDVPDFPGRFPAGHPQPRTFQEIFASIDWDVRPTFGDSDLEREQVDRTLVGSEPESEQDDSSDSCEFWPRNTLHAHMLRVRKNVNLDKQWVYHILCVPRFTDCNFDTFGTMYDAGGFDSNQIPREGLVVAAKVPFPDESDFGDVAGRELIDYPEAYLQVAIHEMGHAMGLTHNFEIPGNDFMKGALAIAAQDPSAFPENILWDFHEEDKHRLRHLPDVWVRPGGLPYAYRYAWEAIPEDDVTTDLEGILELRVKPSEVIIPFGAPLGLELALSKITERRVRIPAQLSLTYGNVRGTVLGPGSSARSFGSVYRFLDFEPRPRLLEDKPRLVSMKLLRGPEGALLPSPGSYKIRVDIEWEPRDGGRMRISGETRVLVTAPETVEHLEVAHRLLDSPEAMNPLVFYWGAPTDASQADIDFAGKGRQLISEAYKVAELRPHFASIEAKCRIWEGDFAAAAEILEADSVMTLGEVKRLNSLIGKDKPELPARREKNVTAKKGRSRKTAPDEVKSPRETLRKTLESKALTLGKFWPLSND